MKQSPGGDSENGLGPAIFIDKDGTLIEDIPFNADPGRIRLMPHAAEALVMLKAMGFALIVASNQRGIALGLLSESQVLQGFARIQQLLRQQADIALDGFCYCPHWPEGSIQHYAIRCDCRKPLPGLLCRAASVHGLQLQRSWMIGDILDDIEAGHRAGCRGMLLDGGNETEWRQGPLRVPDAIARNWLDAASIIAAQSSSRRPTLPASLPSPLPE